MGTWVSNVPGSEGSPCKGAEQQLWTARRLVRPARRSEGHKALIIHGFVAMARHLDFVLNEMVH